MNSNNCNERRFKNREKMRYNDFKKSFELLISNLEDKRTSDFSPLERDGIIRRFISAYEKLCKVILAYLEKINYELKDQTPSSIIKAGLAERIIKDDMVWEQIFIHINEIYYDYTDKTTSKVFKLIKEEYVENFRYLYSNFNDHNPSKNKKMH
jgi:hypothetical protein